MPFNRAPHVIITFFLAITAVTVRVSAGDRPERPNIIFIMADDLGYAGLGAYGQKLIRTPNLDRMSREGMRFTQVYAGCCVCAPSRSVLKPLKSLSS